MGLRTAERLFHRCVREPFVAALNTIALLRKISALGEEIVSRVAGFDAQRLSAPPGREPLQCVGEHRTGAPLDGCRMDEEKADLIVVLKRAEPNRRPAQGRDDGHRQRQAGDDRG